jgi:hypothetical protein
MLHIGVAVAFHCMLVSSRTFVSRFPSPCSRHRLHPADYGLFAVQGDHIKLETYYCVAAGHYRILERVLEYVSQQVPGKKKDTLRMDVRHWYDCHTKGRAG